MYAERRRLAVRAMVGWLLLIALGFGLRYLAPGEGERAGRSELRHLRQENLLLKQRVRTLEERQRLIADARARYQGFTVRPAHLFVVPDPSPRSRSAVIDVGRAEGVRVGQGVIGELGLLGRVARVGKHFARVQLADDGAFRVAFHVQEHRGIAAGAPVPGELRPILLADAMRFQRGQRLLTAGSDGVFPRDIVIGEVVEGRLPYQDTRIALAQPLRRTETVLVLMVPGAAEAAEEEN